MDISTGVSLNFVWGLSRILILIRSALYVEAGRTAATHTRCMYAGHV